MSVYGDVIMAEPHMNTEQFQEPDSNRLGQLTWAKSLPCRLILSTSTITISH